MAQAVNQRLTESSVFSDMQREIVDAEPLAPLHTDIAHGTAKLKTELLVQTATDVVTTRYDRDNGVEICLASGNVDYSFEERRRHTFAAMVGSYIDRQFRCLPICLLCTICRERSVAHHSVSSIHSHYKREVADVVLFKPLSALVETLWRNIECGDAMQHLVIVYVEELLQVDCLRTADEWFVCHIAKLRKNSDFNTTYTYIIYNRKEPSLYGRLCYESVGTTTITSR